MIGSKKVIAIIPARGGSKRLPGKNIRILNGLPLIEHTIRAAQDCTLIDKIIVSTDSNEIADVAVSSGAEVDMRSEKLSSDMAATIDVLKELLERQNKYDVCVTLQPTSPLRSIDDIKASLELFKKMRADSVASVCKAEHPPQWINTIGINGEMDSFLDDSIKIKRSQDLGDYYRLNGSIYCNAVSVLLASNSLLSISNCYAYVMPSKRSVDIDTFEDFELAEYYMSRVFNHINEDE